MNSSSIRDDKRVSNVRPWFGPEQDSQAAHPDESMRLMVAATA
jgi:hypothetical protein